PGCGWGLFNTHRWGLLHSRWHCAKARPHAVITTDLAWPAPAEGFVISVQRFWTSATIEAASDALKPVIRLTLVTPISDKYSERVRLTTFRWRSRRAIAP